VALDILIVAGLLCVCLLDCRHVVSIPLATVGASKRLPSYYVFNIRNVICIWTIMLCALVIYLVKAELLFIYLKQGPKIVTERAVGFCWRFYICRVARGSRVQTPWQSIIYLFCLSTMCCQTVSVEWLYYYLHLAYTSRLGDRGLLNLDSGVLLNLDHPLIHSWYILGRFYIALRFLLQHPYSPFLLMRLMALYTLTHKRIGAAVCR